MTPGVVKGGGRRLAIVGGILLALLVGTAASARADYKSSYRAGVLALEAKRFDDALKAFRQASDENPLEGGELIEIVPGRREPYLPLYYIGLVYYRRGDCARASGSWTVARMSGEVLDHAAQAKTMQDGLAACAAGGSKPETSAATAAPPTAPPAAPAAADKSAQIAKLLQDARTDYGAGRVARARQSIEEARKLGADPAQLQDLQRALASEGAPVDAGPDTEWQAIEAFFNLDYSKAQRLLDPLVRGGKISPRGYLYLACSQAATAVLSGRDVEPQLQRARDLYQKAQAGGGKFDTDWRYISPRLRRLLEGRGPS